jgi:hypothetical protein
MGVSKMKILKTLTETMGWICVVGSAGTDQRFAEAGRMPPEGVNQIFIFGLVLLFLTNLRKRKVKK